MTNIQLSPLTLEDYFILADQTDDQTEFINGEMIVMTRPTPAHQMISGLIFVFLWFCIRKIGGKAYQDVEMVFDDENSVAPDVVYIAKNNPRCQITDKWLYGVPDLAVEILSASTGKRDKGEKYHLYEKYGVAEYWLIDPANQYVEVFIHVDSAYRRLGVFAPDDTFSSPVLGQSVDVAAILREVD